MSAAFRRAVSGRTLISGGFFLVDCATQQEAIAIASECPAAEWLTVEARGVAACFEASQAALLA